MNNSSASVSAIESCASSRKSNENSKSARGGPRSGAKSETLVEMVSDKCLCAQRRGGRTISAPIKLRSINKIRY